MIRLKLNEMLEKRGMSAYALHVLSKGKGKKAKARLHQSVISKIRHNKSKALQLDILSVLCELLECQPADLMVYESTTQNVARATQSAKHTQNESTTRNVARATQSANTTQSDNAIQTASDNDVWLSTVKVAKRLNLSRKSVNDYILDGKLPATKGGDIPNHKGNSTHNFIKLDDVLIYESVNLPKD
jgi:DNA-binding Xre family transcriptional regulator